MDTARKSDSMLLELKCVGDIKGKFMVEGYQRGYRWGKEEVRHLLDDLWEHREKRYCLQPIVVKRQQDGVFELVDGQQRLTTIYLLRNYIQQNFLPHAGPTYQIDYRTRKNSADYLRQPNGDEKAGNIDYFHIHQAWECIRDWFEEREQRARGLDHALSQYAQVIWYQAAEDVEAEVLFTRLNVGKIPLTNAELVKALLLLKMSDHDGRASALAAEWDRIECDLRQEDLWSFLTRSPTDDYPTRIMLLLDALADRIESPPDLRPRYHTFEVLREEIETQGPKEVWERVVDLHGVLLGWYHDHDVYHWIGYLSTVGVPFTELLKLGHKTKKLEFKDSLKNKIRDTLNLSWSEETDLSYDEDSQKCRARCVQDLSYDEDSKKCRDLLFLMNVETVRLMNEKTVRKASERFPFWRHRREKWSLEHIHAQHAVGLTKGEQWRSWLKEHREALSKLATSQEKRDELCKEIDDLREKIDVPESKVDGQTFEQLASKVIKEFTAPGDQAASESIHSIANLALLSVAKNSQLKNAVFEVKRRIILRLDRKGEYIPICTRRVFLKYYTEEEAQMHFWGPKDRENYLDAMKRALSPYLVKENS